jgi:hypothetical protein
MALQKQFHNIDMISGIDQRSDGKGLNSSFLELENGVFRKNNRYQKRNGFDSLDTLENGEDIDALGMLSRNGAPVIYGAVRDDTLKTVEPGIFIKDTATDEFIKKTTTRMTSIDKSSFFGYTNVQYVDFEEDETTGLGIGFVEYRNYQNSTTFDIRREIIVYDYEKSKVLLTMESEDLRSEFTANEWDGLRSFKVLDGNTKFFIFMAGDTGTSYLYGFTIDKSTLVISSKTDIDVTAGYSYKSMDCIYHSGEDKAVIATITDQSGTYKLVTYEVSEALAVTKRTRATTNPRAVSIHTNGVHLAIAYTSIEVGVVFYRYVRVNPSNMNTLDSVVIDTDTNPGDSPDTTELTDNISSTCSSDSEIESIFIQSYYSTDSERRLRAYHRTRAVSESQAFTRVPFTTVITESDGTEHKTWKQLFIKSKAFSYDNNGYICLGVQDSSILNPSGTRYFINSSFIAKDTGESIASFERYESQIYPDEGNETPYSLPTVSSIGNQRIIPSQKWSVLVDDHFGPGSFDPYVRTVERIVSDFDYVGNFQGIQNRNDLYISGGQLLQYDGDNIVEHGFFHEPYDLDVGAGPGGSIPAGDYDYALIYKWVDAGGRSHYSKPRYFSLAGITGSFTLTAKPPCFTRKSDYTLNIFRSVNDNYIQVDESSTMTVSDIYTDAELAGNPILYSEGGVIENFVAPSCKNVSIWNNRLWLTGVEVGVAYWYSKIIKENTPVEFALQFSNVIESDNRRINGSDALGDTIALFKDKFVYYIFGDGPNDLGQGSFSEPKLINTDTGLINPKAIKAFPLGIIYQGNNGYHAILENKQIFFLGHRVDDYGLEEVTGIDLNKLDNELLISTENRILCYNYRYDRWSYFLITGASGLLGLFVDDSNNVHTIYSDTGVGKYLSQGSTYQDNGVDFNLSLKTGWIALTGISGFQRIYRLLVTGDYKSSCTANARAEYNYDTTQFDDYSLDMTTSFTVDQGFTFRNHLSTQKCKAVRFDIEAVGVGRTLDLNNITLEVGIKSGAVKNNVIMTGV